MVVSMPEKHIAKAIARFEARSKQPADSVVPGPVANIITLS